MVKGADGVILVDVALGADEVAVLVDHGGPTATVGLEFDGAPSVVVDDEAIGHLATTHLLALGHMRCAPVSADRESTWHRWVAQYGDMKASDAKRLKELEGENTRLNRLLADAELDKDMLREIAAGNF